MYKFILLAALFAVAYAGGYGGGHGGGYGNYQLGYGFGAGGYGGHGGYGHGGHGGYGHHQGGHAKVQVHQTPYNYQYGLNEQGPGYNKYVHQGASFHGHVPVVVGGYGHGGGYGGGHGGY